MFAVIMGLWWIIFAGGHEKPYEPCGDGVQAVYRADQSGPPGCASSGGASTVTGGGSGTIGEQN